MSSTSALFTEIPVSSLPDFILESEHFKDWRALCPNETMFAMPSNLVFDTLDINTNEDLYRIIECEAQYLFTKDARICILRKIEYYWENNPNASGLELPKLEASYFGDQVNGLFERLDSFMNAMLCMKKNYLELFEYIFQRDGQSCFYSSHPFCVFPLLYYAVINGHKEILVRGIELGCPFKFDLLEPALSKGHTEVAKILVDEIKRRNIRVSTSTFLDIVSNGNRASLAFLLDTFIEDINEFCFVRCDGRLIKSAMKNVEMFRELIDRGVCRPDVKEFARELIDCFIENNYCIDVLRMIETRFEFTLAEYVKVKYLGKNKPYIPEQVIKNDNLELYEHMRSAGYLSHKEFINIAKYNKCKKLSPGLLKKHILTVDVVFRI